MASSQAYEYVSHTYLPKFQVVMQPKDISLDKVPYSPGIANNFLSHERPSKIEMSDEFELSEEASSVWKARISRNSAILFGKPVVKGTRLAVDFIVELLSWGWTESDILDNYPALTQEDILACLSYASESVRRCFLADIDDLT